MPLTLKQVEDRDCVVAALDGITELVIDVLVTSVQHLSYKTLFDGSSMTDASAELRRVEGLKSMTLRFKAVSTFPCRFNVRDTVELELLDMALSVRSDLLFAEITTAVADIRLHHMEPSDKVASNADVKALLDTFCVTRGLLAQVQMLLAG